MFAPAQEGYSVSEVELPMPKFPVVKELFKSDIAGCRQKKSHLPYIRLF